MANKSRLGSIVNPPRTSIPQSKPLDERMVKNNSGGYSYQAGDWDRLLRFLALGSYGGTYYVNENKLTKQNYDVLLNCLATDGIKTVETIVDVSDKGRAQKNDFAIFALAVASSKGDDATRAAALKALPKVCRTGTHLFQFLSDVQSFRGWGRGLRSAVRRWYNERRYEALADQVVKYRSRNGWTHADALRKSHPKAKDGTRDALYHWVVDGEWKGEIEKPKIVQGYELAKNVKTPSEAVKLINEYGLMREALPTELSNHADVWKALIPTMKPIALIRNLGNMSKANVFSGFSDETKLAVKTLTDVDILKANRVHPMSVLVASKQYASGKGHLGGNTWQPSPQILDALNDAFYLAFASAEPTNKRLLVAVDESGSMRATCGGNANMNCAEAAAALALVQVATEPNCVVTAFTTDIREVAVSKRQRLDDVLRTFLGAPSGTDVARPVLYAIKHHLVVDAFIIYTDSETWAGSIHPQAAFEEYKKRFNPNAKMVVCAMVANVHTVGDPQDPSVLQVVGFDANLPTIINGFISGTLVENKGE